MNECVPNQLRIRALLDDPSSEFPDELARHLDRCAPCRRFLDTGKVDLDAAVFEVLRPERRQRAVEAMGAARALRGRKRALAWTSSAAVATVLAFFALQVVTEVRQPPGAPRNASVGEALVEDHIRYLSHPDRELGGHPDSLARILGRYVGAEIRFPEIPGGRFTGGRKCFLLGREAALAFYEVDGSQVSFFALPAKGLDLPSQLCTDDLDLRCDGRHGYQAVIWEEPELVHALVGADRFRLVKMARQCRDALDGPAVRTQDPWDGDTNPLR